MGEVIELAGWISADQAADILGCRVKYVYRIAKYLPPTRIGRALLYRREAVERYADTHPNLGRMLRNG